MASYESFYGGGNYALSKGYGDGFLSFENRYPASSFGFPTDPRTSNQLDAVSKKLNTGATTVEVSGVQAAEFESMPEQHLTEIHRLKKLVGADLTFHGPIIEPTGVTRQGWDETHRVQAERQMWSAVERAHKLDPKGNIVITFHSSASLPPPITEIIDEKTGKKIIKEISVVDENTGRFTSFSPKPDYFKGGEVQSPEETIKKENKDAWVRALQHANFNAYAGMNDFEGIFGQQEKLIGSDGNEISQKGFQEIYKLYVEGKNDELLKRVRPETKEVIMNTMQKMTHGDIYFREAYQDLQNLYNQAYYSAKKDNREEDLKRLEKFQKEIVSKVKGKDIEDPSKVIEFGQAIINGINVLRAIEAPQNLRPLKPFAIDKASETFSNLALKGYKEFKNSAPIISVENPPAGGALSRADELRDLMKESRKKFAEKAQSELGMSESEAKKQAEKLIGITWDVGHINMIRKFGYEESDLLKETKTVAPFVKHIHLSDNFGMEHTELPMGMGNVPIKKEMEILEKYGKKIKDIKKIVETGGPWFRDFKVTPFAQTLNAFGSPVYSMQMAPYWNQAVSNYGGYFSGLGPINPQFHHSVYGAGFSNIPIDLGGQMEGQSRLSGAPID